MASRLSTPWSSGNGQIQSCIRDRWAFWLGLIYIITLSSRFVDDASLLSLLSNAQTPCVILLEDIDCAVSNRRSQEIEDKPTNSDALFRPGGLSLSGVLNAIDGAAAPEGNVLIMTTNFPEKLDECAHSRRTYRHQNFIYQRHNRTGKADFQQDIFKRCPRETQASRRRSSGRLRGFSS